MVPRLLISVRNAAEAKIACEAGADIIDVKEPGRGSLGRAENAELQAIAAVIGKSCPLSVALGEWNESLGPKPLPASTAWVKVGWSRSQRASHLDWIRQMHRWQPARLIGVVYADHVRVQAPSFQKIQSWMRHSPQQSSGILIDTCIKDGRGLLDWCTLRQLRYYRQQCHRMGLFLALAGSLDHQSIRLLNAHVQPDIIAVRGAACVGQRRQAQIQKDRVQSLVACLRGD